MAPTFFGVATYPADNAANAADNITVTPPASMQLGDLVVIVAIDRGTVGTISVSTTGGQTWNSLTQYNGTSIRQRIMWCTFNGTWSASPVVTFGSTTNNKAQMLVFRPDGSNYTWAVDVALANTAVSAPTTPFTMTRTGITTTHANAVALAVFHCIAANTWGTLTGTGWINTSLAAQYRCTSGSGQSSAYAYQVKATTGATNNVSENESAGTAGSTHIVSFYEIAGPITSSQAGNWSSSATWGGHAAPASGDPVVINHAVDVDVDSVCGTGGATGTDELTINTGGTLTIKAGKKLTVQRDANLNGGAIVQEAGSTWEFSGTYRLRWTGTTGNTITINGTSGSRCTFQAAGANTFYWAPNGSASAVWVNSNYCNINRMGSSTQIGMDYYGNATAQSIYFSHCKWQSHGRMDFSNAYSANAATTFKVENCDFRGGVDTNKYLFVAGSGSGGQTANVNTRWFKNCTFVGPSTGAFILLREFGIANPWLVQGCVFEDVLLDMQCRTLCDGNIAHQANNNNAMEYRMRSSEPLTLQNNIAHTNFGQHIFETLNQTGAVTCQDNISFSEGDYENHYVTDDGGVTNFNWDILRCICIGNNAVIARNASFVSTINMDRITHICKDKVDSLFYIESTDVGAASTINLRSSISYSVTTDTLLADNLITSTANQIDYTDYNCVWDRALAGRYGTNVVITGKAVGDAGFGGSDLRADPQFNNVNATIQTWSSSLGGAGTVADAFAELLKMNGFDRAGTTATFNTSYTVAAALAYFRSAFQPTNAALHGTGYSGVDIGAVDVAAAAGSTISCTTATKKQTSSIAASELFSDVISTATKKQSSAIQVSNAVPSTVDFTTATKKCTSAIVSLENFSAATTTSTKKQTSSAAVSEIFTSGITTATKKQSSSISSSENFQTTGSTATKKQSSNVAASELFVNTVSTATKKCSSGINASEIFSNAVTTATKKQSSAIVSKEIFSNAVTTATKKQTSSASVIESFIIASSTTTKKCASAISSSELFFGSASTATKKQTSTINASLAGTFAINISTATKKQASSIVESEKFIATNTTATKKQASSINANEVLPSACSISTATKKQTSTVSATEKFIPVIGTATKKQASSVSVNESFFEQVTTATKKQVSSVYANVAQPSTVLIATATKKQASNISLYMNIPGSGSLLMFSNANNLGGINV